MVVIKGGGGRSILLHCSHQYRSECLFAAAALPTEKLASKLCNKRCAIIIHADTIMHTLRAGGRYVSIIYIMHAEEEEEEGENTYCSHSPLSLEIEIP